MMMKKLQSSHLLLSLCAILFIVVPANAESRMYTTTIKDTTIPTVQEAIINVFTPNGFAVTDIGPNKINLNKTFGDGFFLAIRNRTITLAMFPLGEDVKLMVTQSELQQGMLIMKLQNSIDHLIPLIKSVRNRVHGTPLDLIVNETVNIDGSSEMAKIKEIGFVLFNRDQDGHFVFTKVDADGCAKGVGIEQEDTLLEVNGRTFAGVEKREVESYINEKWVDGVSLVMLVVHEGNQKLITLKREK